MRLRPRQSGSTFASAKGATEFLGYDTETAEGVVRALVKDGAEVKALANGEEASIVLNQTPFYGESGGQVGDQGIIRGADGAVFRVTDTQKKVGDVFVHTGKVEAGKFAVGDAVELEVDHSLRQATRANHSATHLIHEALAPCPWRARCAKGIAGGARAFAVRFLAPETNRGG